MELEDLLRERTISKHQTVESEREEKDVKKRWNLTGICFL